MKKSVQKNLLRIALPLIILCVAFVHAEEVDPTRPGAKVVAVEPEQSLDVPAPASQFIVPNGEDLWKKVLARAMTLGADRGGGFFDATALVGEGFRTAKKFQSEKYVDSESGSELQFLIAASEATKETDKLLLTDMRLVYFVSRNPMSALGNKAGANSAQTAQSGTAPKPSQQKHDTKPAPATHEKKSKANDATKVAGAESMALGGRIVISAPNAVINTTTNEGYATGNVKIEIYQRTENASDDKPVAVLSSEHLRWRTWSEAAIGSTELALYATAENPGDPLPLVTARYMMMGQTGGQDSTIEIEARGLVYELGSFDRPSPKEDSEGRTIGLSDTARNRALFHHDIKLKTTATAMSALLPFQANEGAPATTPQKKQPKPRAAPTPESLSQTIVYCHGPAILDMATVPKKIVTAKPKGKAGTSPKDPSEMPILLARRFEFLNDVNMIRYPLGPDGKPPAKLEGTETTRMSCRHLCLQWPAGVMPQPSTLPEYMEAIDGVNMQGIDMTAAEPGKPPVPNGKFEVVCNRVFYDGLQDNMFLVGDAKKPVRVDHEKKGNSSAQQFCYQRKTQTLTMPQFGPKMLTIRPDAMTPPPGSPAANKPATADSPFNLGAGDTVVRWNGPFTRELRHLPVPGAPDRIKEILSLQKDVSIEQAGSNLKLVAQNVQVVRNNATGAVEFLEGVGGADASMGQLQARGEYISVDMDYDVEGNLSKNITTVIGSRAKEEKALLFMQSSAVCSDKFIIDRVANTFFSTGGAVAVVHSAQPEKPPEPKPDAAKAASGLVKTFSFDAAGNLFVQCDGEFSQDAATHKIIIKKNVIIKQPGMQLLADEVHLTLEDPPPPDPKTDDKTKTPAKAADAKPAAAPGNPTESFFNGDLKTIDCIGTVEVTTDDQLVHCDRLFYDKPANKTLLQVNDPDNDVRVYLKEESGGTKMLSAKNSLELDSNTGTFQPGGLLVILPYRGEAPTGREKEKSPARSRAQGAQK